MTLRVLTNQEIIDQLNSGMIWGSPTITYSFAATTEQIYGDSELQGFSPLAAAQQDAADVALQLWDELIAATFRKVAPSSSTDIEFGNSSTGVAFAHAYFPWTGSVWFNSTFGSDAGTNNLMTPALGRHGFVTFIHEIGHALGLNHMGNYNGDGATPQSFQDSTVYSVMSYFGPSWGGGEGQVAWADWTGADGVTYSPQTPMLNDILAIQAMYGVDTTTRTGDTIYGFNSNVAGRVAQIFDFTINRNPILTIFDSGGVDTIDLSGYSSASVINLAAGSYSSCNSMTSNIAIAYGCDIENAVAGAGNDTLNGNALNNRLEGAQATIASLGSPETTAF